MACVRTSSIAARLRASGLAHATPAEWGEVLTSPVLADWETFAASWDRLDRDDWMADGGSYRRRRFAAFALDDGIVVRKPHQPHFQSRLHNRLNGGVDRWFSPVEPMIGNHPVTHALLTAGYVLASSLTGGKCIEWHAEMHQFRIEARPGEKALPTPEGLHRDGVTAVLMMLVGRDNASGGVSEMRDTRGELVARIELATPLEGIVLDDRRLHHEVSAIGPAAPDRPAVRDALVLTFREGSGQPSPQARTVAGN